MPSPVYEWHFDAAVLNESFMRRYPHLRVNEVYFLALALGGETGELQNIIKKVWRGDFSLEAALPKIRGEVADILIYLHHLTTALGIGQDEACVEKIAELRQRWPELFKP